MKKIKVCIFDLFNCIKRYSNVHNIEDLDTGELIDTVTFSILNRMCSVINENPADLIIMCSDLGYNKRAQSVVKDYKANRARAKSLSKEEKEKNYIEFIKKAIKTLPCPFIDVDNTEADMLIRCVITYLKRFSCEYSITIVSSDSDFIQLLDDDVKIYDWYKGKVTKDDWYIKHKKHDKFLNIKNYTTCKAIAGDTSDNITGLNGWGWGKVTKLIDLLNLYNKSDLVIDNIHSLLEYIKLTLNNSEIDKKHCNFISTAYKNINAAKQQLIDNLSIIDLDMVETPHLYKIYSKIEQEIFGAPLKFNRSELLKLMDLSRYSGNDPIEHKKIVDKNSKSMYVFYMWQNKANTAIKEIFSSGKKSQV